MRKTLSKFGFVTIFPIIMSILLSNIRGEIGFAVAMILIMYIDKGGIYVIAAITGFILAFSGKHQTKKDILLAITIWFIISLIGLSIDTHIYDYNGSRFALYWKETAWIPTCLSSVLLFAGEITGWLIVKIMNKVCP